MSLKASRVGSTRLREVLASGRLARTALFSGKALPAKAFRFSVTVSKKNAPNASERNKIRRRCREAFRAAPPLSLPKIDLVVSVRADSLKVGFQQLKAEALALLGCYSTQP